LAGVPGAGDDASVVYFVSGTWESFVEFFVFLVLEVVVAMHFIPDMLLYRTTGRWLLPLLPLVRGRLWFVWPVRVFLEGAESLARISEHEAEKTEEAAHGRGHRSAGGSRGGRRHHRAGTGGLDQQVVEFSDKRVREVMTPRPSIVAMPRTRRSKTCTQKLSRRN